MVENEGGLDDDKPDNHVVNSIAGTVSPNEEDKNNDFVEEEPEPSKGSWSGNVSKDTDNDDTGDVNLSGVDIKLFEDTDGDGQPDGVAVATTTTDSDGNYHFADLTPGDYVAVETQPVGLDNVKENEGGEDDDKPDNNTVNSIAGTVEADTEDKNNDFVLSPNQIIVGPSLAGLAIRAPHLVTDQTAEDYIRNAIVNSDAYIVNGYLPSTMFTQYRQELTAEEIDALVAFLSLQ